MGSNADPMGMFLRASTELIHLLLTHKLSYRTETLSMATDLFDLLMFVL